MLKLFAISVALSLSSCPGAIGKALRLWGYTEVRPASTFIEPGTLVEVGHRHPFKLHVLCTAKQMLGEDFVPQASDTQIADLSRINKSGASLDVDVANIVNSNNALSGMSDVKMKFDNARVFEVTDHDIYSRRDKTSPHCLRSMQERVRDGFKVTMVASALRADVVYTVKWDRSSKLGIAAKIEALANLSAKLGAEASPQTLNTISGKGLYWGIRDDVWLAYRYLEPGTVAPIEQGSRIIPTEMVVTGLNAGVPSPTPDQGAQGPGEPNQLTPGGQGTDGRKTHSVSTDYGEVTYDVPDAPIPQDFALVPAYPDEDWHDVVLEPKHDI